MDGTQKARLRALAQPHLNKTWWQGEMDVLALMALDRLAEIEEELKTARTDLSIDLVECLQVASAARDEAMSQVAELEDAQTPRPMTTFPKGHTKVLLVSPGYWGGHGFQYEHIVGWLPLNLLGDDALAGLPPDYAAARDMAMNDELPDPGGEAGAD